jgi:hypothetical protein
MPAMQHRALVGAIRWDAWHGELSEVGKSVEKTLSPPQYRFRLPWFAQVWKDGTIRIRGDLLGVLEQEIVYARMAGLDYWAFVTYPEDHPLSLPLRRFADMPPKHGLRFCNIVEWERFGGPEGYHRMVRRLVGYFSRPHYQRVRNHQPLVYLLAHESRWVLQQWGYRCLWAGNRLSPLSIGAHWSRQSLHCSDVFCPARDGADTSCDRRGCRLCIRATRWHSGWRTL